MVRVRGRVMVRVRFGFEVRVGVTVRARDVLELGF